MLSRGAFRTQRAEGPEPAGRVFPVTPAVRCVARTTGSVVAEQPPPRLRLFVADPIPRADADQLRQCDSRATAEPRGVADRRGGQDRAGAQVLGDHRHDPVARTVRQFQQPAVGGRQAGIARQRHAQRLRDARHRRGGAHRVAVAAAVDHRRLGAAQVRPRHPPGPHLLAHLPDPGPAAQRAPVPGAVEHRAAGHHQGGQVHRRGAHDQRRDRLVTAAEQHDPVDGVGPDQLLDDHRGEVAEVHGRRSHQRLAQRGHRHLQRHAARLPHAPLHMLGDLPEVPVARGEVRPGVADDDLRAPVERVVGQAAAHPRPVDERVAAVPGVPGLRPRRTRSRIRIRTRHRWPRSRLRHTRRTSAAVPGAGSTISHRAGQRRAARDTTARQPHAGLASYAATARLLVGTRVR